MVLYGTFPMARYMTVILRRYRTITMERCVPPYTIQNCHHGTVHNCHHGTVLYKLSPRDCAVHNCHHGTVLYTTVTTGLYCIQLSPVHHGTLLYKLSNMGGAELSPRDCKYRAVTVRRFEIAIRGQHETVAVDGIFCGVE